ncbi:hypothetical protein DFR67_12630 [Williamsia limnetica]|uniref:Uncharacterized protein n=2 Tax=Williamsia limnetica TaxID=882452 RepID=A0A318RAN2_WILLI|nr:hypothetical protein DFR67_12630 [Williamsia limnetica]
MATWAPVLRVLNLAAERVGQRRRALWPLVGFAVLAASVVITSLVCVGLGTELIGGPDRPTICDFDEFGCRPTVDRSGPATPQAVHALYVLAAIALVGLAADAVVFVRKRWYTPPLTCGMGDTPAAPGDTPHPGPDAFSGSPTTLLDHNDRSPSHD